MSVPWRRPIALMLSLCLAGATIVALGGTATALTPSSTKLDGITFTVWDVEVNAEYVFVMDSSSIEVVDHAGHPVDSLPIQGTDMAVVDQTLYATFDGGVAVWDLESVPFERLTDIALSTDGVLRSIAHAGGRLWIACGGSLCSVPVMGGPTTVTSEDVPISIDLESSPSQPNRLWVSYYNPGTGLYDVSTATAVLLAKAPRLGADAILSRDGSLIVGFDSLVDDVVRYDGLTLEELDGIFESPRPTSGTFSDDGSSLFTVGPSREAGLTFRSFDAETQALEMSYVTPELDASFLVPAPDGTQLFIVGTRNTLGRMMVLPSDVRTSRLTIKAPQTVDYAATAKVVVHLGAFKTASNTRIRLYMKVDGASERLVADRGVDASGDLVYRTNELKRNVTFRAVWDGDERYLDVEATALTGVRVVIDGSFVGAYGRSGAYALYHAGEDVGFLISVTPKTLEAEGGVDLERYRDGAWRRVTWTDFVLKDGKAGVVVHNATAGVRYRLQPRIFEGDGHVATRGEWAYFRLT